MPELPEVETVRLALEQTVAGKTIGNVRVMRCDLRTRIPTDFERKLIASRIQSISRRGKYLQVHLSDGYVMVIHLGMSGTLEFHPDSGTFEPDIHDHVIFSLSNGLSLVYSDPRRFGQIYILEAERIADTAPFKTMGPEPMGKDFTADYISKALHAKKGPIKNALMDQKVVAGLGNIYVCEALFYAGISPKRKAGTIAGRRSERLCRSIRDVLEKAIEAGGSSLKDYKKVDGSPGYFQHSFAVYDRTGRSCPGCDCIAKDRPRVDNISDGKGVRQIVQAGRSTFYCPVRQR